MFFINIKNVNGEINPSVYILACQVEFASLGSTSSVILLSLVSLGINHFCRNPASNNHVVGKPSENGATYVKGNG